MPSPLTAGVVDADTLHTFLQTSEADADHKQPSGQTAQLQHTSLAADILDLGAHADRGYYSPAEACGGEHRVGMVAVGRWLLQGRGRLQKLQLSG